MDQQPGPGAVDARRAVAALLVALTGALLLALTAAPAAEAARCKGANVPAYKLKQQRAERAMLCLVNKQRTSRGMRALRNQRDQKWSARRHNRHMVKTNCFAHVCPGGQTLIQRLTRTSYLPCNCFWGAAENIAYGTGPRSTPRAIVRAWMNSPGHRANILNRSYRHLGSAVHRGVPIHSSSPGATFTHNFGFRR